MVKIIVLAYGMTIYTPPTPTFQDEPPSDTFYPYVETAAHNNIVSGYNCGGPGGLRGRDLSEPVRFCRVFHNNVMDNPAPNQEGDTAMSNTRILSADLVYSVDEDLSILALCDDPTVSREAQRLRTLINTSSRENGGPAVISKKDFEALGVLLGKERLP